MNKEKLKEMCLNNSSFTEIEKELNMTRSQVRYWIKKYELKRISKCKYCGDVINSAKKSVCDKSSCRNKKYINRWKKIKIESINLLGGCCRVCGYNNYNGALEFHHVDPNEKDADWTIIKKRSEKRRIEELKKCVLLCSNCHKEVHAGIIECPDTLIIK